MYFGGDPIARVILGGHEYQIARAHLGKHLVLEQLRKAKDVVGYLQALELPTTCSGLESLSAYVALCQLNRPKVQYPMFKFAPDNKRDDPWEYPNRWVLSWINLVASAYHWSRAEIFELDVDEFYGYVQEILVDQQLAREFQYSLSEMAFPYDEAAKARIFKPLKRPVWMQMSSEPKKQRIPKQFLPIGLVVGTSD
jgi:hypothetical protein